MELVSWIRVAAAGRELEQRDGLAGPVFVDVDRSLRIVEVRAGPGDRDGPVDILERLSAKGWAVRT